ncbi:MAG: hypothetical protein EAZ55_10690 [Cytophagales bacterium]|nr:MAG: hypothetical protein EAZ55_10690 [Cytophagales bacterium]
MRYEIQIFAKDKTKIIRFSKDGSEDLGFKPAEWEDFYYAMGSVIDDKADSFVSQDTIIAKIEVNEMYFEQVIDSMCEDLSSHLTNVLVSEKERELVELTALY